MNNTEIKTWTQEDSIAACADGWDVFSTGEPAPNGPVQIQKLDEPGIDLPEGETYKGPVFETDFEAMAHVATRATEGSDLHQRALDFVRDLNPDEYRLVLAVLDGKTTV